MLTQPTFRPDFCLKMPRQRDFSLYTKLSRHKSVWRPPRGVLTTWKSFEKGTATVVFALSAAAGPLHASSGATWSQRVDLSNGGGTDGQLHGQMQGQRRRRSWRGCTSRSCSAPTTASSHTYGLHPNGYVYTYIYIIWYIDVYFFIYMFIYVHMCVYEIYIHIYIYDMHIHTVQDQIIDTWIDR